MPKFKPQTRVIMNGPLILLPSTKHAGNRLVQAPDDFSERDAVRQLTALIASVQEQDPEAEWDDIAAVLEDNGFAVISTAIGPTVD